MTDAADYCPTRGGTYTAYEAEYKDEHGNWKPIPIVESAHGIPQPRMCRGINDELGLFGREQAWALAWQFAAVKAATSFVIAEIRVAQYEVKYDLKARRLEMPLVHAE